MTSAPNRIFLIKAKSQLWDMAVWGMHPFPEGDCVKYVPADAADELYDRLQDIVDITYGDNVEMYGDVFKRAQDALSAYRDVRGDAP